MANPKAAIGVVLPQYASFLNIGNIDKGIKKNKYFRLVEYLTIVIMNKTAKNIYINPSNISSKLTVLNEIWRVDTSKLCIKTLIKDQMASKDKGILLYSLFGFIERLNKTKKAL